MTYDLDASNGREYGSKVTAMNVICCSTFRGISMKPSDINVNNLSDSMTFSVARMSFLTLACYHIFQLLH